MREDDLDRESGIPLSRQIADQLEADIRAGKIPPHRAVPSEAALVDVYLVSRDTARRAVRILRDRGLIYTVQGKGSYVTPPEDRPTA